MNPVSRRPLPAFYYLRNFEAVLSAVSNRYADILSAKEGAFISEFSRLPKSSAALLVRMIMRTHESFRASRLKYAEIGDLEAAMAPLLALGWVECDPALSAGQLQTILTKAELIDHFGLSASHGEWKKAALIEMLSQRFPRATSYRSGSGDRVYQVQIAPLCERLRLMFFGNEHQDWAEFVLTDLGLFTYEKIDSSRQTRAFRCREDIDVFQQLQACREALESDTPLAEVLVSMPTKVLACDWLEEQRQSVLFAVAREYERVRQPGAALELYLQCSRAGARVRAIRLYEHQGDWSAAHGLCLLADSNPHNEVERQQVARILPRLCRKLKQQVPIKEDLILPCFEVVLDLEAGAVEYEVRDYLAHGAVASMVHYVENQLICSLFGLLCWPAIFAPVAGAFFHDFQRAPADLSSAHFVGRREGQFRACFAQLESDEYASTIRKTYTKKRGIQSPFVHWSLLDPNLLERALCCFPAAHLKCWFEWMARDITVNRAGFPDLVQFWPTERRYRLIEVKGPGDKLQDNQKRFLELCVAHDMPVSICMVKRRA
jgi:hypothetical protein